jgi:hypothetical protein
MQKKNLISKGFNQNTRREESTWRHRYIYKLIILKIALIYIYILLSADFFQQAQDGVQW